MKIKIFRLISLVIISTFLFAGCADESLVKSNFDVTVNKANLPNGIVSDKLIEDYGVSAIVSASLGTTGSGADTTLNDLGAIASTNPEFDLSTANVVVTSVGESNFKAGAFEVEIKGLELGTKYYWKAFAQNKNGIIYGDVKEFTTSTSAVFKTPYKTDFTYEAGTDSLKAPNRLYWVLDKYTGYDTVNDYVWWSNFGNDAGDTSLGNSIAAYYDGTPLNIVSPKFKIAGSTDTLCVKLYAGLYGHSFGGTAFSIYITEDLANLGTPVKSYPKLKGWYSNGLKVPMTSYYNKQVYIVFQVTNGDVVFYRFSIAKQTDPAILFK